MFLDCDYTVKLTSERLSDDNIVASSVLNALNGENTARIQPWSLHGYGWIPAYEDTNPWLEVRLDVTYSIRSIMTQGCGNEDIWVTEYSVGHSSWLEDEISWYMDQGSNKVDTRCIKR